MHKQSPQKNVKRLPLKDNYCSLQKERKQKDQDQAISNFLTCETYLNIPQGNSKTEQKQNSTTNNVLFVINNINYASPNKPQAEAQNSKPQQEEEQPTPLNPALSFETSKQAQQQINNQQQNSEDCIIEPSKLMCCYCQQGENTIPICRCSVAHQKCANEFLQSGSLEDLIKCQNCNEDKQLLGRIKFNFQNWKKHKLSLSSKLLFLVIIVLSLGFLTYIFEITGIDVKTIKGRMMVCSLVFSYTIGLILFIGISTSIISHFKYIELVISRFDHENIQKNKRYLCFMRN